MIKAGVIIYVDIITKLDKLEDELNLNNQTLV
jgi:hypothetical protein